MTDLLSRPPGPRAPRRPPAGPPARPLTLAGMAAAAHSAGLGVLAVMVIVLVGWATAADSDASASTAVAAALQTWLAGHGTRMTFQGGTFSLLPLGLAALPAALLYTSTVRAGRTAGVAGRRGVIALTSAVTATYAVLATVVALLARTAEVRPTPSSAFLGAIAVAALAAGAGSVRATGRWLVLWLRVPPLLRLAVPPALGALAVLVAGGALLVGATLAVHHQRAASLVTALDPGVGGTVLLMLGSLLYVPTAVVWGTAYAVGPGFAVGQGTGVGPFGSELGPVPALPLLAALPESTAPGVGLLALAVPFAAAVLAVLLLRRSGHAVPAARFRGWRQVLEVSGLVGSLVAAGAAGLTVLASGSAGPGRMAEVGPAWWAVGPLAGLEVAAVVAMVLLALDRRGEGA